MARKTTYVNWDTVPVVMDLTIASHIVGLSVGYLRKLAKARKFPAFQAIHSGTWRIGKDVLMNWIESQGQEG